jgi:hypothetical protein
VALTLLLVVLLQLEMVDPGTVLMWIFGSILALLWLLFVCVGKYTRQQQKTLPENIYVPEPNITTLTHGLME